MRRALIVVCFLSAAAAVSHAQPLQIPHAIVAHPVAYRNELGPWNACDGQVTISLTMSEIRLEHYGKISVLTHLVRLPAHQGEGSNQDGFSAQREGDGAAVTVLIEYDARRDADALWIILKESSADRTVTYRVINRPEVQN
jgi:hypothetical protein